MRLLTTFLATSIAVTCATSTLAANIAFNGFESGTGD